MRLIDADLLLRKFTYNDAGERIAENDCDNLPHTVTLREVKQIITQMPVAATEFINPLSARCIDLDGVITR